MRRACLALCLTVIGAVPAQPQCRLCAPSESTAPGTAMSPSDGRDSARPLTIDVEAALDFSRAAETGRGGGTIDIDPLSGARRVSGLADLGGFALKGRVRLTGTPLRHVRVDIPSTIQLTASDGGVAEVVDVRTDLGPDPAIGADGTLVFGFGGRLIVKGYAAGELRGRIPVTADYQ